MLVPRIAALLLIVPSLWATEYHSGQAARAVLGQSSFSSKDAGIRPISLSIVNGRLAVLDADRQVQMFDLAAIPPPKAAVENSASSGCAVCGIAPLASANQPVAFSSPRIAMDGKNTAVVDTANRRVLIWRGGAPGTRKADVVLGNPNQAGADGASILVDPVSVAMDGQRLFVGDAALHRVMIWNSLPAEAGQPADAVLGQPDFNTLRASTGPDSETVGNPAALASDGANLFVADTLNRRILLFSPADTPIKDDSILNSASLLPGPAAPGSLITIAGQNLSDSTESAADDGVEKLPKQLGGVQVVFDGLALPLLSVSPTQIRAQLPYDFAGASSGSLLVRSEFGDGAVKTTTAAGVRISIASPGLFAFGGPEPRDGLIVHADGSPVTSEKPAYPGELITAWAAGLGAVASPQGSVPENGVPFEQSEATVTHQVDSLLDGRSIQVISASLPPGSIGIYELKIQLPSDISPSPAARLAILQNGIASNTILLPVGNPKS